MIRNALLVVAAIVVVGAGFVTAFAMWNRQNEARAAALGVPYTAFNMKTAHGLDRGCNACHADHLAADVSRLVVARDRPELHGIFKTSYDIPMRIEDCRICHGNSIAGSIHSLHHFSTAFVNMGGNCDSCHATVDGKFVLYDDQVRYYVLNGVTRIPTPAFSKPAADEMTRYLQQLATSH